MKKEKEQTKSGNKDNGIRGLTKNEHTKIKETKNKIRQRIHEKHLSNRERPRPG